jgi:hypothetical protein
MLFGSLPMRGSASPVSARRVASRLPPHSGVGEARHQLPVDDPRRLEAGRVAARELAVEQRARLQSRELLRARLRGPRGGEAAEHGEDDDVRLHARESGFFYTLSNCLNISKSLTATSSLADLAGLVGLANLLSTKISPKSLHFPPFHAHSRHFPHIPARPRPFPPFPARPRLASLGDFADFADLSPHFPTISCIFHTFPAFTHTFPLVLEVLCTELQEQHLLPQNFHASVATETSVFE